LTTTARAPGSPLAVNGGTFATTRVVGAADVVGVRAGPAALGGLGAEVHPPSARAPARRVASHTSAEGRDGDDSRDGEDTGR
jgi:hypothetical protein